MEINTETISNKDSPHSEMMLNLFLALYAHDEYKGAIGTEPHFKKALELLKSGSVNPHEQENQLFRELKVQRFYPEQTELIYEALRSFGCKCEMCV
jgi:hypothetical protein